MSLTTCLKKAGEAINADDKAAILDRSRELRGEGKSATEAAKQAVDEQIAKVRAMLEPSKDAQAPAKIDDVGEKIAPMPSVAGIPRDVAQRAHEGTSHVPERRAEQEQQSFLNTLRGAWDRAAKIAGADQAAIDRITEVFTDVADGYRARYMATLGARSRVMSSMIAGPARFPVERNRKRMETERKRSEEAQQYLDRGIKRLIRAARGPIDNSPEAELERVRLNLNQREEAQEQMKAANVALRKGDDEALRDLGFTDEQIAELKKPDFAGRKGFPDYKLTNNNAEIRRLRDRLQSAEQRMEDAAAGPAERDVAGVRVVEDATADRLRLYFDGKPSDEVRDTLKSNGFRWSPREGAWQRQLTDNARRAADAVLAKMPSSDKTREDDAGNVAMFSQGEGGRSTIESVNAEIAELFPGDISAAVTVVQTADDLPTKNNLRALFKKFNGRAVTIDKNHAYIVADRIEPGTARGTLMHELGVHIGLKPEDVARFHAQIERWAQGAGQLADMATEALARQAKSDSTNKDDEAVAYMLQFMVDAGMTPGNAPTPAARSMLQKLLDAIKAALEALGLTAKDISPQDMVDYVYGAAKMALDRSRPTLTEANAVRALSENDELFALPKSRALTIESIAADIDPAIKVEAHPAPGLDRYELTMPNGAKASIFVREPSPYGPHRYGKAADHLPDELVRPGEDQWNMRDVDDVWIDVSKLKAGGGGSKVYAIAGDFAHNTGRVFIGDPTDVSEAAMVRRPEAMLSSALRWGTTAHLAPHPKQKNGSKALGIPPLDWVADDHLGNIRRLIDLNLRAIDNATDANDRLTFDPATGRFRDGAGAEVQIARGESAGGRMGGYPFAGRALAGSRTLARAAVWRALLREGGGQGPRAGRRDGLLARLARLADDRPQAVERLFSQRLSAEPAAAAQFSQPPQTDSGAGDIRFSQHTDLERDALARAGIRNKRSTREAIRSGFGRAQQLLRDRGALWSAFRQANLDQFHGIDRAVRGELGGLPPDQDPYVAARLANGGTSGVMRALLLHGQARWAANGQHLEKVPGTKGLLDILAPLGDDLNVWFGWMVGNRAARLKAEGREHNLTEDQIKALQGLAKTPEQVALFKAAAKEYAAFKRSVLDVAEKAGLIDPAGRAAWDHADHIPFYRQIDAKASFSPTGRKGLAGQSSGIRVLKGGEAALNDPMENLLMNFSRLIDASLKNNAIRKTVTVLKGTELLDKIGYDMAGVVAPKAQVRKVLIEAGTPEAVLDAMPDAAFDGMAKLWAIQAPSDPDVVRVMVDGKPQFYRVADPMLLKALTSFVPFDFPGLFLARGAKRILTRMVTSTPDFMLRNFIRDSVAAQGITRHGFNPAKSLQGILKSYTESGAFEPMLFAGASFQAGNVNAADPTGTAQAMRRALRSRGLNGAAADSFLGTVMDKSLRGAEHYFEVNEAVENSNREAVYEATLQDTGDATAAAYEAKDLMDFSLRGSSAIYQLAADVLPFFNARVQGMYRLGRSDPKRLVMVGLLMMTASLLLAMANDGEDWYEELEDWDKDTYWHFMIGGKHFRLPKPFELGVVFATFPERIGRAFKGLDTSGKTADRAWANVRDQLAIDPVPQVVRPPLEVWANKDRFRDRPIENIGDEGKLPSARFSANTSDTARVASQAMTPVSDKLGLSPKALEHMVHGYFGTVGAYALGLSDMLVRKLEGQPARPELRLDDLPVVKSFYREHPARATVYESDLYKMRDEVTEIANTVRAYRKAEDDARADALEAREEKKLDVKGDLDRAAKRLSGLRKERDEIMRDPGMTPADKRKAIDELQIERNQEARETMRDPAVRAAQ